MALDALAGEQARHARIADDGDARHFDADAFSDSQGMGRNPNSIMKPKPGAESTQTPGSELELGRWNSELDRRSSRLGARRVGLGARAVVKICSIAEL